MTPLFTAVFKAMYHAEPCTEEQMGCSSEELAEATAEHAFGEADLGQVGNLALGEFSGARVTPGRSFQLPPLLWL